MKVLKETLEIPKICEDKRHLVLYHLATEPTGLPFAKNHRPS